MNSNNTTKGLNSYNVRVEEDKLQTTEINNIYNKNTAENSPHLDKEMTIQTQEAFRN